MSGRLPGPGEALADVADGKAAGYTVPAGGTLDVRAASGATVRLRVSGTGLNLAYTPGANSTGIPVFYASAATAQALSGTRGYNHLGFRLTDDSPAAQNRVIAEVRAYLTAQTGTRPDHLAALHPGPRLLAGADGVQRHHRRAVHHHGPRVRLRPVPDRGHDEHAHRRAGPRDRHPQGARRPATADRRHHRPHRGDARPGGRDRRHRPRRRRRLPAGPLLRRAVRRRARSASACRSRSSWPAWWPARCSRSPRRCPPCGARCAGRWPRPSPEPAPTAATGPAGSTGRPRAAACWPGGFPTACAWDSATCCGNGGAAWP